MERKNPYSEQVALLVAVLPAVAMHPEFGLKGGTAINLFFRDMPRLSVDIDLVYLPVQERAPSLTGIKQGLLAIGHEIERIVPGAKTQGEIQRDTGTETKMTVRRGSTAIKIEVSTISRGHVLHVEAHSLCASAETLYGPARLQLLAFEEVYAGKLCAALNRQHPRDLYDVRILLRNEGISESLKNTFLVYLMGSDRPMVELLDPNLKDIRDIHDAEFRGMTLEPVTVADLEEARRTLVVKLHQTLTDEDRNFLLAFKRGEPNWQFRLGCGWS
jgi:predicted nucleotidyltransferase component of viral defense system